MELSTLPSDDTSLEESIFTQPEDVVALRYYDEEATRVHNMIEEKLKRDAETWKKSRQKELRVLLIGQAESGKSTLRKKFQLQFDPQAFELERPSWVPVIYFNIIKAVQIILGKLDRGYRPVPDTSKLDFLHDNTSSMAVPLFPQMDETIPENEDSEASYREIQELRVNLLPLVALVDSLATVLSAHAGSSIIYDGQAGLHSTAALGWPLSRSGPSSRKSSPEVIQLTAKIFVETAASIKALWQHDLARHLVIYQKLNHIEAASFFLDEIGRIAKPGFLPSNNDILRARLGTTRPIEYTLTVKTGGGKIHDWKICDTGGARYMRYSWLSYFDDASTVIFVAPIGSFDQYLEEDSQTNRLGDTLSLFRSICSTQLLRTVPIILLLNKTDLLKSKLVHGVKVRKYLINYGNRPNTYEAVVNYLRTFFVKEHKKSSREKRPLHVASVNKTSAKFPTSDLYKHKHLTNMLVCKDK